MADDEFREQYAREFGRWWAVNDPVHGTGIRPLSGMIPGGELSWIGRRAQQLAPVYQASAARIKANLDARYCYSQRMKDDIARKSGFNDYDHLSAVASDRGFALIYATDQAKAGK